MQESDCQQWRCLQLFLISTGDHKGASLEACFNPQLIPNLKSDMRKKLERELGINIEAVEKALCSTDDDCAANTGPQSESRRDGSETTLVERHPELALSRGETMIWMLTEFPIRARRRGLSQLMTLTISMKMILALGSMGSLSASQATSSGSMSIICSTSYMKVCARILPRKRNLIVVLGGKVLSCMVEMHH